MNSHLNIFKTYTKETRQFQLENDLTRAFAICIQENTLFFNDVLKAILDEKDSKALFSDIYSKNEINISIQKSSSSISDFEKIYAVSLSEHEMTEDHFWKQNHETRYDPISDIVVNINGIAIIIEAKRNNWDSAAQLYNQAYNICQNDPDINIKDLVIPKDLNWFKLMEIAVRVHSFEKAAGVTNRFLKDFINLVKDHNFRWLPEPAIFAVSSDNKVAIKRRVESAVNEFSKSQAIKKLEYNNRLGLWFNQQWAQEVLFDVTDNGNLSVSIYPGNTKAQGSYIFFHDPHLKQNIEINNKSYALISLYHVKFTSFQRYFTGLWFDENSLDKPLYTKENFKQYCGRKKRDNDWDQVMKLFDQSFKPSYDWKAECQWNAKVVNSGRNQFDLSFGYQVNFEIPFKELRDIDQDKSDLSGLTELIKSAYEALKTIYSK